VILDFTPDVVHMIPKLPRGTSSAFTRHESTNSTPTHCKSSIGNAEFNSLCSMLSLGKIEKIKIEVPTNRLQDKSVVSTQGSDASS